MSYSFHEHTADVRMHVESKSFPALFRQSLLGVFEFLRPIALPPEVEHTIDVRSPDSSALLVDFLNEALSQALANKETYDSVQFLSLHSGALRAKLRGHRISSFGEDIKAITYHEAKVQQDEKGVWHAHIVFDI